MEVTSADVRALVERAPETLPVTSVYLNTDGAQYPRAADYETRLDGLLREVRLSAESFEDRADAVRADAEAISQWVRHEFQRGSTRGLGLFSSGGEVFESVQAALSVRNVARVAARPYVVPLEALLGRSHHIALALVGRDRARVLRYRLGRLEEHQAIESDVHRQHEQGGWAQARYQRTIEHEVLHHYKDVAEVLRVLHEEEPIASLVLAGPETEVAEFSKLLHPYLEQVRHPVRRSLPLQATLDDLHEVASDVEQELVSGRRRLLLERLAAGKGQAGGAAWGVRHVLEAVNAKRIETLFVVEGAGVPGYKSDSGALALREDEAAAYGGTVARIPDLIDEIIEHSVLAGAHVELFRDDQRLDGHPVAALLRF